MLHAGARFKPKDQGDARALRAAAIKTPLGTREWYPSRDRVLPKPLRET